jgi:Dyp-type peroxidase family
MSTFTDAQLRNIQGFGIAGFRKDHQDLMFIRFGDAKGARRLLKWLAHRSASAWEVAGFNAVFSEIRSRTGEEVIEATWIASLVSAHGYQVIGVDLGGLPQGEGTTAFTTGMAQRAAQIGDTRPSDEPTQWLAPFRPGATIDLAVVVASDDANDLAATVERVAEHVGRSGCEIVFQERGRTLPGRLRGHEHFGFRDGASQPAIDGYDNPPAAGEPPAAAAGEFVLGYPDSTGATATTDPLWTDGSFVVFRRLRQDVASFRHQVAAGVPDANPPLTADALAAKMLGRWPDGAPVELYPDQDPGEGRATNAFGFGPGAGDDDGQRCPRWAHIRKANPRDETTPDPTTDTPARHRMIRRGSPFGPPLRHDATTDDGHERGLHFLAVVADLARQFEFVQRQWLNDPNFPGGAPAPTPAGPYAPPASGDPDGPDPIVGEHDDNVPCVLRQPGGAHPFPIFTELVTVTAGEYFFLPSLSALQQLAEAK